MTTQAPDNDPLGLIGKVIADKYEVERFVAEGGFSVLYRAQHRVWKQPVAIKFLKAMASAPVDQRQSLLDDFIREGQLLRQLSSRTASILQAHDVGVWEGEAKDWYPYLILEWLEGRPLDAVLDEFRESHQPPLTLQESMRTLEPAAKALEVVHRRGIAHRDIKPANIFVVGDLHSDESLIKVLDFGIAKVLGNMAELSAADAKTGSGISSFTPWYGAPEQFSKRYGATGPWTDVFALALIFVEMMTLREPLEGEEVVQLALQSSNPSERPTPRTRGVNVTDEVEAVFRKALAVNPPERYATAGLFWNDLCKAANVNMFVDAATQMTSPGLLAAEQSRISSAMLSGPEAPARDLGRANTVAVTEVDLNDSTTNSPSTVPDGERAAPPGASRLGLLAGVAVALGAIALAVFVRNPPPAPGVGAAGAASAAASVAASAAASAPAGAEAPCPEGMVRIPGGDFYMGFDGEGAQAFEQPPHPVKLSPFCIDVTEVTVESYRACSDGGKCLKAASVAQWPGASPAQTKIYSSVCNINSPGRDRHPINCVSWEMASNYCQRQGKRLPTSAEWEFAVRGPDGRTFPWGDEPPDANHLNACGKECIDWGKRNNVPAGDLAAMHQQDDGYPTTAPVGSFPKGRSRYGLDDVIGNVMEWVQDWDGPYSKASQNDPTGPETGTERVIRGGAWNAGHMVWTRPSFRFKYPPDTRSHGVGFRCAK